MVQLSWLTFFAFFTPLIVCFVIFSLNVYKQKVNLKKRWEEIRGVHERVVNSYFNISKALEKKIAENALIEKNIKELNQSFITVRRGFILANREISEYKSLLGDLTNKLNKATERLALDLSELKDKDVSEITALTKKWSSLSSELNFTRDNLDKKLEAYIASVGLINVDSCHPLAFDSINFLPESEDVTSKQLDLLHDTVTQFLDNTDDKKILADTLIETKKLIEETEQFLFTYN